MKRLNKKYLATIAAFVLLSLISLNLWVVKSTQSKVYAKIEKIPANDICLVLGTSRLARKNRLNLHFKNRISAAAALYHAGKVKHILVSGDNHIESYDEPTDMKNALMDKGVPEDAITLDYAGFRTLDSIVRAKEVFGLSRFTIVSDRFHDFRALFISNYYGLDAIAFAAEEVPIIYSFRASVREYLARYKAVLDLYVLKTEPKFLGAKIVIEVKERPDAEMKKFYRALFLRAAAAS